MKYFKALMAPIGPLTVFLLLGLTFAALAWGNIPSGEYRELIAYCIGFIISYLFLNVGTPKPVSQRGFVL